MQLAPQFLVSWMVLALVWLSGACATTMSPDKRQRILDCVAQCDAGREPQRSEPMGPLNRHDTRTDCEKRCQ